MNEKNTSSVGFGVDVWTDRKTKTGGLVYDHAWDAIMYLEQRTEFWRQEQPPMIKARKRDKTPVITEKMRINNWVSREVDKIDNGTLLRRFQVHHHAKFHRNCRDIAVFFHFSRWQLSAILDLFSTFLDHPRCIFGGFYCHAKFG